MRAFQDQVGKQGARRAWLSVGAPVLGLVVVIIALAIATFAGFAREQDRAFAESTQRLAASAAQGRADSLAAMLVEYANWDAAFANISADWNDGWVDKNIYSSIADAMFVLHIGGAVRHAWYGERVIDPEGLRGAAIEAALSAPNLRMLARAATPGETVARTHAIFDGRWVVVAVAPVTPEGALPRPRETAQDFIVAVDVIGAGDLAAMGAALGLEDLRLAAPGEVPRGAVAAPLNAANGQIKAMLQWRHAYPGSAAFAHRIWFVVLGLLSIGLLTVLLARHLVSRQIEALSSAQAAQTASDEKSAFLGRVSAELRSPLSAVIGYAELIAEDAPRARADAKRIIEAARELSAMLGEIIDQSHIDVRKVKLSLDAVPVAGLLAEVQGLMHPVARAAGVDIAVSQEAQAVYACADHARLRQCLLNIVGNAVKFSPRGGLVRLRAALIEDMIQIEISDSGLGVAADELGVIFRPFTQANAGVGAVYGGLGLGLSIAQSLAREMGGDVSAVSAPGEGSIFYLRVPTVAAHALSAA